MAKRFNRNLGNRGSRTLSNCSSARKDSRKSHRTKYEDDGSKVPGSRDDIYEEHVKATTSEDDDDEDVEGEDYYEEEEDGDEKEEIGVHNEPSIYDNLLKKLENISNSHAEGQHKRYRPNG